jgi:translation elongation factor EF-Ts
MVVSFIGFVDALGDLALKTTPANIEAFLMQTMENGDSLEKAREDIVATTADHLFDDVVWLARFFGLLHKNRLFSFKNICR